MKVKTVSKFSDNHTDYGKGTMNISSLSPFPNYSDLLLYTRPSHVQENFSLRGPLTYHAAVDYTLTVESPAGIRPEV